MWDAENETDKYPCNCTEHSPVVYVSCHVTDRMQSGTDASLPPLANPWRNWGPRGGVPDTCKHAIYDREKAFSKFPTENKLLLALNLNLYVPMQ
jgi:hypothetical protein